MTRTAVALAILASLGCAHAPQAATPLQPPAEESKNVEDLTDHAGDSPATAISVPEDATDGGATFENQWIFDRYGRFRRVGGGTGTLEGRRYNVVKIELASGEKRTVYFDITELWAKSLHE